LASSSLTSPPSSSFSSLTLSSSRQTKLTKRTALSSFPSSILKLSNNNRHYTLSNAWDTLLSKISMSRGGDNNDDNNDDNNPLLPFDNNTNKNVSTIKKTPPLPNLSSIRPRHIRSTVDTLLLNSSSNTKKMSLILDNVESSNHDNENNNNNLRHRLLKELDEIIHPIRYTTSILTLLSIVSSNMDIREAASKGAIQLEDEMEHLLSFKKKEVDEAVEENDNDDLLESVVASNQLYHLLSSSLKDDSISNSNNDDTIVNDNIRFLSNSLLTSLRNKGINNSQNNDVAIVNATKERLSILNSKFNTISSSSPTYVRKVLPIIYEMLARRDDLSKMLGYESYVNLCLGNDNDHDTTHKKVNGTTGTNTSISTTTTDVQYNLNGLLDLHEYYRRIVMGEGKDNINGKLLDHSQPIDPKRGRIRLENGDLIMGRNKNNISVSLNDVLLYGLIPWCKNVLNIELVEEDSNDDDDDNNGRIWHPKVKIFSLYEHHVNVVTNDTTIQNNRRGKLLGYIYLDPHCFVNDDDESSVIDGGGFALPLRYRRPPPPSSLSPSPDAPSSDTSPSPDTSPSSSSSSTSGTPPAAVMCFNFKKPVWNDMPISMNIDDIVILFHEFGHCLQLVLAGVDNEKGISERKGDENKKNDCNDVTSSSSSSSSLSSFVPSPTGGIIGTNFIEVDDSEIMSQFMEYWLFEGPLLKNILCGIVDNNDEGDNSEMDDDNNNNINNNYNDDDDDDDNVSYDEYNKVVDDVIQRLRQRRNNAVIFELNQRLFLGRLWIEMHLRGKNVRQILEMHRPSTSTSISSSDATTTVNNGASGDADEGNGNDDDGDSSENENVSVLTIRREVGLLHDLPHGQDIVGSIGSVVQVIRSTHHYPHRYLWSGVIAADVFGAFREAGLDDASAVRDVGKEFREIFLQRTITTDGHHDDGVVGDGGDGGNGWVNTLKAFRNFRGRDPNRQFLEKSLQPPEMPKK